MNTAPGDGFGAVFRWADKCFLSVDELFEQLR